MFENFLYCTLNSLRRDARYKDATIVVLADNASVHKHSTTYEMVKRFGGVLLFNSQYSPHLQPIEYLFGRVKQQLRMHQGPLSK